jgi:hypothetical protein
MTTNTAGNNVIAATTSAIVASPPATVEECAKHWQENHDKYGGTWTVNYRELLDNDLLARIFICPNTCHSFFVYTMKFLRTEFDKNTDLNETFEIFDEVFEISSSTTTSGSSSSGSKSGSNANNPVQPCEKTMLILSIVHRFPPLINAIVKDSSTYSTQFIHAQCRDSPKEYSIVDWLIHQPWNETNVIDILNIAKQMAATAYFSHGLPFALDRDKNPRTQMYEYMLSAHAFLTNSTDSDYESLTNSADNYPNIEALNIHSSGSDEDMHATSSTSVIRSTSPTVTSSTLSQHSLSSPTQLR